MDSRSAAVIFVEMVAMTYVEVQRTGKIILPVRCTSCTYAITKRYKYFRGAAPMLTSYKCLTLETAVILLKFFVNA